MQAYAHIRQHYLEHRRVGMKVRVRPPAAERPVGAPPRFWPRRTGARHFEQRRRHQLELVGVVLVVLEPPTQLFRR